MVTGHRPLIVYADGPGSARISPDEVAAQVGLQGPSEVFLGWTLEEHAWLSSPTLSGRTYMAGYALLKAVKAGRLTPVPVRLSAIPSFVEFLTPDVVVVAGIRRGNSLVFGPTVGWGPSAVAAARQVVVEVDDDGFDFGGPEIGGNIVAVVSRPATTAEAPVLARPADEVDLEIGRLVASMLPDDPTLQFGPGGIGEAIARALDRPVRLWSGLLTDAMAGIEQRGLLRGQATACYVWGGEPVRELYRRSQLRLVSVRETHDLSALSAMPRFVGCNTALQVGLDGSINIEQVGGRTITSIGGHSDFCAGASRSAGGLSVIALRSTTNRGASAIVAGVERVSTQRSDIGVVVTEHGIADLRGIGDAERAERLTAIAAPEFRAELAAHPVDIR